ncbi:multidrug effflux MFS transporter [Weissella diestrammenae]|uniref:Bcr/CflA family efflux transporter n=1 Tax=Weissella diestrammenae TaxID=1162633 RepID=A0A7G9T4C5_9LACO|nr:multidrug effflux MFS transporter [Weissella diestrammenae]MCM0583486.1 multidrug effflux MFS transporter [Weissella diestrammenae]QNN74950.1 multidrug effflux MFS transporter [Weissella diestrammenae]
MTQKVKLNAAHIFILGVLSAFAVFSMDFYLPGLPQLQKDLNTSASLAQLTITASLVGLGLGQLVIGPWSDRIGRRRPLLIGTLIFTLTSIAIVLTSNIWILILMRFFQGLAGSVGIVLSLAVITDSFSGRDLTNNVMINQSINGIFPVIAPVLGGIVVAMFNWEMTFWILAGLGISLFLAVQFYLPETREPVDQSTATNVEMRHVYQQLFANRQFMVYMLLQTLMMAALFAYISGSSFVLENIFHLNVTTFGIVYAINGLGIAVMTIFAGWLANRWREEKTLGIFIGYGLLGGILLALSLFMAKPMVVVLIAFFMIVSAIGGIQGMTTALAMKDQHANPGAASALLGMMRYAIGGVMSPLVGIFGTRSYVPLVVIILVVQLLAMVLYLNSVQRKM